MRRNSVVRNAMKRFDKKILNKNDCFEHRLKVKHVCLEPKLGYQEIALSNIFIETNLLMMPLSVHTVFSKACDY